MLTDGRTDELCIIEEKSRAQELELLIVDLKVVRLCLAAVLSEFIWRLK